MIKFNRVVSVVTIALMSITLFAGCGGKTNETATQSTDSQKASTASTFSESGFPIVKNKLTLKMIASKNSDYNPSPEMWYFKEMEKKTNINFQIEGVSTTQWTDKKNLMFASNELPDVIVAGFSPTDIITYGNAKQIVPITNYIDKYAPTYKKLLAQYPERGKLNDPNGDMYGLTWFVGGYMEVPGARCFINTKWLKNVGLSMPQTYDDFYNALVAFRDKDPDGNGKNDTIPLSGYSKYSVEPFVAGPLGIPFRSGSRETSTQWMLRNGKPVYVPSDSIYKEYLTRMRKLYQEKLLDQEYFTQNEAQMKAKGQKMSIGAFQYAAPFVLTSSTDPAVYGQYEAITPMTSEFFKEKVWYGDRLGNPTIFITSANKYPEATMRYFDYMYTEEGSTMLYGPELGKWDGEGGVKWNESRTSWQVVVPSGYTGVYDWLNKKISPIGIGLQGNFQYTDFAKKQTMTPEDKALYTTMNEKFTPNMKAPFPDLFFTKDEQQKISLIQTDINTYVKGMQTKFIIGEEPMSKYDEFITKLKSMKLADLTAVYEQAYERYAKASK